MISGLAIELLRLPWVALPRKSLPRDAVTSAALIELTGLGDVISMLPSIRAFKSLFPSADLHLVVDSRFAELLAAFELPVAIHGVLDPRSPSGVMAALHLVRDLRVTLACSMSPPRRNALVTLAGQARCIAGYLQYRDTLTPYLEVTPVEVFGLSPVAGVTFGREHISQRALKVCQALGYREELPVSSLRLTESIRMEVRTILQHAGLIPAGKYVVLHPFAGWKSREWPLPAFGALAKRLLETENCTVIFLWQQEKQGDLQPLRRQFAEDRPVIFASTLSLLGSAALISGASLFVGNDSGPLHLAAALGVPSLGLFGPCDPHLTAPHTPLPTAWLYKQADCSPCDQRSCLTPDSPCMETITVEEVFKAAVPLLRRAADA